MFINSWRRERRKNKHEYKNRVYIDEGDGFVAIKPIVDNVYRILSSYGLHNGDAAEEIVDYCLDEFCPYPLRDLDYEPNYKDLNEDKKEEYYGGRNRVRM